VEAQGDHTRAAELYREGLALAHQVGDRRRIAFCLEGLGQTTVQTDPERAVCWLGAAAELRNTINSPLPAIEQTINDEVLAQLHEQLSPEIFEAAWNYGRLTSLAEVVTPLLA
jgi:hypothetical protein